MSNALSGVTAKANVPLLPYLCTRAEVEQYSKLSAENAENKLKGASTSEISSFDIFSPLVIPDCLKATDAATPDVATSSGVAKDFDKSEVCGPVCSIGVAKVV